MAKQLQLRRGTTAQHSTFTGAVGEITVDTDKDVVVVHDGSTTGGFPSQKELVSGTNIKTVNSTTLLGSGDIAVQPTLVSGTSIKTVNSNSLLGSGDVAVQPTLVSGTNIKTVNSTSLLGSGDIAVQPTLVSGTSIKTVNSNSLLGSGDVAVQPTLVSGTNIKSINNSSLLGSGDIAVPQLSGLTAYHLLEGSLALASTTPTSGFSTTLYTGNGATQSINTGVDMATQWGDTVEEKFGGLVWVKSRSNAINHVLEDTIRGSGKRIFSNSTASEDTGDTVVFGTSGFTLGNFNSTNTNAATYASWNFQTTHRTSGTTNHGKAYTCHYNPYTGFTIVRYEGSGIAGHEIPHHLGRKLGIAHIKMLTAISNWVSPLLIEEDGASLQLNLTAPKYTDLAVWSSSNETSITLGNNTSAVNNASGTHILYGWANSYFDSANTLIGNYEIGIYQGTGASGNKVKTRGKPAWVMMKRLDSTGNWWVQDNLRTGGKNLYPNLSNAEEVNSSYEFIRLQDGFSISSTLSDANASGGQYLYMVVYDNDSGSGKSKYPKPADAPVINLTAKVPFANGVDVNGTKLSILSKNESISGVTLSQGKNYVYCDNTGAYGKSTVAPSYGVTNPASGGDFFNLNTFKWYTSAGAEITNSRNYLDAIVYGDTSGNAEYIEQLPKTVYYDRVKANEYQGKNACTAWVNFDGTTTPPTIRDSFNVSGVIRTATGRFDIYFENEMDNRNISIMSVSGQSASNETALVNGYSSITTSKVSIRCYDSGDVNRDYVSIQVFGGKN